VDEAVQKRLVYVKALYMHGQEHAKSEAEFDRMISLHHFDNAVELLLKCVATNENADIGKRRNVTFPDLWSEVEKKLQERGISLQKRTEMQQLHDLRSDIQHWGAANLSLDAVNRFQVYSEDFIQLTLKEVFGIEFEKLSLSLLIRDKRIKDLLAKAELVLAKDPKESMKCSSVAFSLAEEKELARIDLQFPNLSLTLSPANKAGIELIDSRLVTVAEDITDSWEEKIRESLDRLEDVATLLVLGINVSDYSKYKKVAPIGTWHPDRPRFQLNLWGEEVGNFTNDNAAFCFNFVLKQVLRWQEKW
jgi:hypothetical protein